MSKSNYANFFSKTEELDFSGEEITIFKRYIEENNVNTENCFEYFEDNLNYYSTRQTSPNFFSPSQLFQVNSNFKWSNEMQENINYYNASVRWAQKTIYPEDSKYVIKQEKYKYINEIADNIREFFKYLNNFTVQDYHCLDILYYSNGVIYKFLSGKNFVFTWRKNCSQLLATMQGNNFYQCEMDFTKETINELIIPIFVPVRETLFLGEFGYRDAIISYGQIIERILHYLNKGKNNSFTLIRKFDNYEIHKLFNVDGVNKNIMDIIVLK